MSQIHNLLYSETPFFSDGDYVKKTREELFAAKSSKKFTFVSNTENRIWRIVKDIFSVLFFPIGICRLLHSLVGKILVPASFYSKRTLQNQKSCFNIEGEWKIKRIAVKVDGYTLDAYLVGKSSTLQNKRWTLSSMGNGESIEHKLNHQEFRDFLEATNSNGLIFNPPGVGASSRLPSRTAMAKAYRGMLQLLEKDVKAQKIFGYGHSLGGGVQTEGIKKHTFKKGIDYTFVKSRTFSTLSTAAKYITRSRILSLLVKIVAWDMNAVWKKPTQTEIILQTANGEPFKEISNENVITHDGIFPKEATLAHKALKLEKYPKRHILAVKATHNEDIVDFTPLLPRI